ncbi:MAG: prepilin-type N-terminal cleavage/methylation domain-containing protein [Thermodesulfobacteriaceae bacterium]|nr:prepilin-type N-terminal cleavage/methylation domain-containing protein [Thermodesulfobacteriaceae bacterium]
MTSSVKGYTLLEVLIASLIFSAMIFLATLALDQSLKQYQSLIKRGLNFWEDSKILWLQRSLSSALDYYVYEERKNFWFPFFIGKNNLIAYISLSPFSKDLPVLVVLKREIASDGKESLVYYELPIYTLNFKDIEKILNFEEYKKGTPIIFLEGLESLDFKFYGYDRFKRFYDWFSEYESSKSFYLPSIVKVEFTKEGVKDSIYGIINVQNLRKTFYNEFYKK